MPTYEYLCPDCGPFEAVRPMAEYQAPHPCDGCGADAPRAILSAPVFAGMDAGQRRAHATNERSAHVPKRTALGHGAGCRCCRSSTNRSATQPGSLKGKPSARPWMISH